jgi:hypothetical protein
MSAIALSYIVLIMLGNIPFTPSFFRAFIMKRCWILLKPFNTSVDKAMWALFLLLFICYMLYRDLHMLNNSSIQIKPIWSWSGSLWWVSAFSLSVFCWESLHLYSLKMLVCNSLFSHIFIMY